jgi:hypothetical protein
VLLVLLLGTCNQAIMTAPPGSTLSLSANPEHIAAHGDVSVITAFVLEATGTPVSDGTVVQFFTNLGRIDEQGKTNDGVARVNLVSDSRSGTAHVTAVSGGDVTATPTTTTMAAAPPVVPAGFVSAMTVTGATAVSAAAASGSVDVVIGTARTLHVIVTAVPRRIIPGRTAQIIAVVFDESGNPVPNVPVVFTVTGGQGTESLDSQGRPVFTDNNGQATDVLRTRATVAGEVTVHATTSNAAEGTVTVEVGPV